MPDLRFQIEAVEAAPFAATPTLIFKVRIDNRPTAEPLHTIVLRCQIRIEPGRRAYRPEEQNGLRDLFGTPDRWAQTLRSLLWTHVNTTVPGFTGTQTVDLEVPCTFDFNVAATKYFAGVETGDVPLTFLFSGSIFYERADGALQVAQVPWEKEAAYRLPVGVWRTLMDQHYPNTAWLCLRREVFDRLHQFKIDRGLPTWEEAVEVLLAAEPEVAP
jgi:hypothetical protein